MIVFHHNDADGKCAAAVINRYYKNQLDERLWFCETDYKDEVSFHEVDKGESVFIVDFSFRPEVMNQLLKITPNVHWCDHHKTAEKYEEEYAQHIVGYRDYNNKGLCGAECTWKYLFPKDPMPHGLVMLGDYDSWRMAYAPNTLAFYEGLKIRDLDPVTGIWNELLDTSISAICTKMIISDGDVCIRYRDQYCKMIRQDFGYSTEIEGFRAYAMNTQRFGSQGFGNLFDAFQVCIAYIHDGHHFNVSLYSKNEDVSVIAKKYGGGGHRGAAGFSCKMLPWRMRGQARDDVKKLTHLLVFLCRAEKKKMSMVLQEVRDDMRRNKT